MESNMTTMAAEPVVPYPMISNKDVIRTCPPVTQRRSRMPLCASEKAKGLNQWMQYTEQYEYETTISLR
jgi:hypothetical protein